MRIGQDVSWDASPDGLVDEVRLWEVARSDMQILASKDTTIAGPTAGLVAVWNFDGDLRTRPAATPGRCTGALEMIGTVPTPTPSPVPSETPTPSPEPSETATSTPSPTPTATPEPTPSPTPTPSPKPNGDVNCSGAVNAVDALQILRYVAGLPVNLPLGARRSGR